MMSIFGDFNAIGSVDKEVALYSHAPDNDTGIHVEDKTEERNFNPFYGLVIIFFVLLVSRLLILQVAQGANNLQLAEGNRIRTKFTPAPRGMLFDSLNKPLVKNIARYDLGLIPTDLPRKKTERQEVYKRIKDLADIHMDDYQEKIEKQGLFSINSILLKTNISQEEALKYEVAFQDVAGVAVLKEPVRLYPTDKGLGHVLGYIGKVSQAELKTDPNYKISDWVGKAGLEKTYEKDLKGISGQDQIEIDAQGRLQRIIANNNPKQGNNIRLGLDLSLQEVTHKALSQAISDAKVKKGVAIALNPQNGAIYSLVSLPDYDPNYFIQGNSKEISNLFNNQDSPLLNRAINGSYPPGSSIKPIYAMAGLQEKTISPTYTVDTPSSIKIGDFVFPDWKDHGTTDIRRAIAESNNIIFYAIGGGWDKIKGIGIKKMDEYLEAFRFNKKTGIDLPGEQAGFIPTPDWKKEKKKEPWYIGDTYHLSIGQGDLSVTPIQLAVAISSVANNGRLVTPHLVEKVEDVNGRELQKIEYKDQSIPVDAENIKIVKEGMRQTVELGSARIAKDDTGLDGRRIEAAGKTGTAQTGKGNLTHAWFAGFAPWDNPKIVVVVLLEEGGEGNVVALPVAREMLKNFFREENPASK